MVLPSGDRGVLGLHRESDEFQQEADLLDSGGVAVFLVLIFIGHTIISCDCFFGPELVSLSQI